MPQSSYYDENTVYQDLSDSDSILADMDAKQAAASASAAAAATSASEAASSATFSSNSATAAATSETNASASKTAAASSATAAATSATNSANSATAAATSATNSANSATAAATSATNASTSATNAAGSATSALNSLKAFRDQYLGPLSSDPTTDVDGNAVGVGDMYFNTVSNSLKIRGSSAWATYSPSTGDMLKSVYDTNGDNLIDLAAGGTGSGTAAGARTNLGLGTAATQNTGTSGATVPLLNAANSWSTAQTVLTGAGSIGLGFTGDIAGARWGQGLNGGYYFGIYNDDNTAGTIAGAATPSYNSETFFAKLLLGKDGTLVIGGALDTRNAAGTRANLGLVASATTDTTNASNISSGTLAAARGGAGTVNGLMKANGSGVVSAATANTDYLSPPAGSAILKANSGGALANATAGIDYMHPGTTSTVSVGFALTPYGGIGTVTTGTVTPAPANGNYQYYTNNGAHTLAAPASDCAIDLLVTNGASAGAITFSGFTVGSSTGSSLTTTSTHKFVISIRRINGVSTYSIYALQ